jgi:hypothetical protein
MEESIEYLVLSIEIRTSRKFEFHLCFRVLKPHPRLSPAKKAGQARKEPHFDIIRFFTFSWASKSPFGGFRGPLLHNLLHNLRFNKR